MLIFATPCPNFVPTQSYFPTLRASTPVKPAHDILKVCMTTNTIGCHDCRHETTDVGLGVILFQINCYWLKTQTSQRQFSSVYTNDYGLSRCLLTSTSQANCCTTQILPQHLV